MTRGFLFSTVVKWIGTATVGVPHSITLISTYTKYIKLKSQFYVTQRRVPGYRV